MTTNSVLVMILSVTLLCLTTSTPSTIAKGANKKPNSLSLKLLHRSSIPLFENETFQDFLENHKQLYMGDSKFFTTTPLFQATVDFLYFVNLSIGDPPVPQYLAVDTGSSVVWVISNSANKKFLYLGRNSSTYTYFSCSSPECSLSPSFHCSPKKGSNRCLYKLRYANDALSYGILSSDRFVFPNNDCDFCDDHLDKVLFGVATYTNGSPVFESANFNGLLGLGPKSTSLLRNFPKKFSYCIGDIYDKSSRLSFLVLGDVGDWYYGDESMYVPLNHNEHYRVDMESIEFGQVSLSINQDIFKYDGRNPFTGVIFDTGAVFTFLADTAYDALVYFVDEFMRSKGFVESQNKDTQICYDGQREEISDFPLVSFRFVDHVVNADLRLKIQTGSLFYNANPLLFCISMIKSSTKNILMKDFTIIGVMAQQNHTLTFDLETSRMSIDYSSCES